MRLLTFDLGTTLYKVAVFDETGRMLAVRRVSPRVLHPRPPWWEMDPRTVHQPLIDAAGELRQELGGFDDVAAVSFATQANSFVLLDERNEPLTPIILWPDERAREIADELEALSRLDRFRSTTGMPRFSHLLALAKVLRWKRTNAQLLVQTRKLCYLSDLLTLWMTGLHVAEAGVAGLSGAMDLKAFGWWDEMLTHVGLATRVMPRIVRAGADLGPVKQDVARELGLPATCRFVVGCLDQYAGAIGTGTVEPRRVCETTGTVLAAVRCSDQLNDDPPASVFQGPGFEPDRWWQMSFSSTSANLLEHYRSRLNLTDDFDVLTREAMEAPPSDLVIHPFDRSVENSFRDVQSHHTRGQVVRAIMQCVARALAEQVRSLCPEGTPGEIRAAGGASRNDDWLQLKANVLGAPFASLECQEPTSLGAAILAGSALGLGDVPTLSQKWVKLRKRFDPQ
jgi:xylulokinase